METAKEAIICAAMKGVRLHGLYGVRVRHISQLAEVLPSSIYAYFNGKEDLMQACFSYVCDLLSDVIQRSSLEADGLGRPDKLYSFWSKLYRWMLLHPDETVFFHRYCDRPDMKPDTLRSCSCFHAFCAAADGVVPSFSEDRAMLSWLHVVLGTVRYAGYTIQGILPDKDAMQTRIFSIIFGI